MEGNVRDYSIGGFLSQRPSGNLIRVANDRWIDTHLALLLLLSIIV